MTALELRCEIMKLIEELGDDESALKDILEYIKSKIKEKEDERDKARKEFGEILERMRKRAADLPEMSLEEINAEIAACRAERKQMICE